MPVVIYYQVKLANGLWFINLKDFWRIMGIPDPHYRHHQIACEKQLRSGMTPENTIHWYNKQKEFLDNCTPSQIEWRESLIGPNPPSKLLITYGPASRQSFVAQPLYKNLFDDTEETQAPYSPQGVANTEVRAPVPPIPERPKDSIIGAGTTIPNDFLYNALTVLDDLDVILKHQPQEVRNTYKALASSIRTFMDEDRYPSTNGFGIKGRK